MKVPEQVVEVIRGAKSVLIATHSPMDGDGLGCGLALLRSLRAAGKEVHFVTEAPVPRAYHFMPDVAAIRQLPDGESAPVCDLLLGLDAGEADRLGRAYAERAETTRVVNIDHHVSNTEFGDVAWVDPDAGATGELVHGLFGALDLELGPETALCLLVSLVTDTGRFCYSNTSARTLEIAADLLRHGANPDVLQRNLYGAVPLAMLNLRARAAEALKLSSEGRVAMLTIPAGYGADLGADDEDVKDLVDLAIGVDGVVVAALVRGLADGSTKVSLRSKDDRADVAAVAARHGGGGHVRAAGFSGAGDPAATEAILRPELEAIAVAATG